MPFLNPHSPGGQPSAFYLLIVSIFVAFSLIQSVPAQEPDEVLRVRTDLVAVPVVVTDPRGRRVAGLQPADFSLKDSQQPVKIDYFAAGTERVALLFALDVSGSVREIIERQRDAALALLARFGRGSRVAVLHFSDVVQLTVPFTSNSAGAVASFVGSAKETRGTAIFDAAAAAVRSFDGSGGFSMERRIVVLISDGLDTLSSTKYTSVIASARQRGVSFYVIHFPIFSPRDGRLEPRPPAKGFRELGEQTGGRYFRIGDAQTALNPRAPIDLTSVFQAIENDLRGQYVIGFYPGDAGRDKRFHPITVELVSRRGRKLRVHQYLEGYDLKP